MTREERDLVDWTLEILTECCLYTEGDSLDDREMAAILKIGKAIEVFQDMRDAKGSFAVDDVEVDKTRMPREK